MPSPFVTRTSPLDPRLASIDQAVRQSPLVRGHAPVPPPPPGRLEYKHMVPNRMIDDLRRAMKPYVVLDAFSEKQPDKQYTVRSIYYDNRRMSCYWEKFDGYRLKKKFRIRGYNKPQPDSTVFLEIKRREEDFISKSRAPVRWDQLEAVFGGYGPNNRTWPFAAGTPQAEAAGRFLYNYYRRRLAPAALIAYEREAFFGRFDPRLRLTFDKNVRSRLNPPLSSLYEDRDAQFLIPDHFIFEVKFYQFLPRWVRNLIRELHLQRMAFSKYAAGIEIHRIEKKLLRGVGHTVEFPLGQADRPSPVVHHPSLD
jgi:hypothetical protein